MGFRRSLVIDRWMLSSVHPQLPNFTNRIFKGIPSLIKLGILGFDDRQAVRFRYPQSFMWERSAGKTDVAGETSD